MMNTPDEQKLNASDRSSIIMDDAHSKSTIPSQSDPFISFNQPRYKSNSNRHAFSRFLRYIESKIWITALILPLVPIVFFAIWLPFNGRYIGLESKKIGNSSLSQIEAKVIDFFCSVVIAPCIVTAFDYLWFSYARVLAVNEVLPKDGIPIEALASTSSTDSGSFDFIKVWGLVETRKWTIFLFALMILLSGSTKSLFSNVIAYEASNTIVGKTELVSLQSLAALFPPWYQSPSANSLDMYNFSITQKANFSSQFLSMLTDLSFHSGADKLEDKYFISTNATTPSLNLLPSSVGSLFEVPGYRLSIDCQAVTPTDLSMVAMSLDGNVLLELFVGDNPTKPNNTAIRYTASFTGGMQTAFGDGVDGAARPFVGFTSDPHINNRLYLGFLSTLPILGGVNNTGEPSPYGELKYMVTNQTVAMSSQPANVPRIYYAWGISCKVTRQTGFHKLERTNAGSWQRVANASRYKEETDLPQLRLSEWAWEFGYRVPQYKSMPGFGPVFTTTAFNCSTWPSCGFGNRIFSYEKMALNALYAIGDTNHMLNEISMQNAGQNGTFQVSGGILEQRYRITYVPLILFGGFLTCLCACLITFGLLVYHWRKRSRSFRMWRKVNVTRLLADAVDGLRDEYDFYSVSRRDNTAVREWSEDYDVRYVESTDENGITIKLQKFNK